MNPWPPNPKMLYWYTCPYPGPANLSILGWAARRFPIGVLLSYLPAQAIKRRPTTRLISESLERYGRRDEPGRGKI
jgi:hypothetical protein